MKFLFIWVNRPLKIYEVGERSALEFVCDFYANRSMTNLFKKDHHSLHSSTQPINSPITFSSLVHKVLPWQPKKQALFLWTFILSLAAHWLVHFMQASSKNLKQFFFMHWPICAISSGVFEDFCFGFGSWMMMAAWRKARLVRVMSESFIFWILFACFFLTLDKVEDEMWSWKKNLFTQMFKVNNDAWV